MPVLIAVILSWIYLYLESRLTDEPRSKISYFKGMMLAAVLVAASNYIGGLFASGGPASKIIPGLGEEVIVGPPPF
ncbi:MAG: hypothetical protein ACYCOU_03150 [Sulfobacillus sp.]